MTFFETINSFFRTSGPDLELFKAAQSKVEMLHNVREANTILSNLRGVKSRLEHFVPTRVPPVVKKVGSVATGVSGAISAIHGIASIIPEPVIAAATSAAQTAATTATYILPESVVNAMPTVVGTTAAFSSVLGAGKQVYEYGSATISWGRWIITALPVGMQIGLGIGVICFAYWMWRGGDERKRYC